MAGYSDINNGSLYSQAMAGFFSRSKSATLDNMARKTLVSRSRILYLEAPVARACIDVLLRECVGSGLRYAPRKTSVYFDNYPAITEQLTLDLHKASDLHLLEATHRLTFNQLQSLIFRTILLSGDCFLIRLNNGDFCVKESDYCYTPSFLTIESTGQAKFNGRTVIDGVELNEYSQPIAYWFCNDLYAETVKESWIRIPAFDSETGLPQVLHCAYFERPDQFRGLPLLAPVIEDLWSLRAYLTSETQMSILQCNQSWCITTNTNPTVNPFVGLSRANLDAPIISTKDDPKPQGSDDFSIVPPMTNSLFSGAARKTTFIQPGTSIHLAEGEDIKAIAPTAPHSGLETFIRVVVEQIGAAVGIPSQILMARIDSNYASCKAAFAELQHTVRLYRTMFTETFLKPFFQCFCYDDILNKGYESTSYTLYEAALLIANESLWLPSQAQTILEPNREIEFYSKAIELGLVSKNEVAQMLFGHDAVESV